MRLAERRKEATCHDPYTQEKQPWGDSKQSSFLKDPGLYSLRKHRN